MNLGWLPLLWGLGLFSRRYGTCRNQMPHIWVCEPLRDFKKVPNMTWHLHGKALEVAWVGLEVEWGSVLGNHQCGANRLSD